MIIPRLVSFNSAQQVDENFVTTSQNLCSKYCIQFTLEQYLNNTIDEPIYLFPIYNNSALLIYRVDS